MRPIADSIANAMPDVHAAFVEWVESSKAAQAAILQNRMDLPVLVQANHAKLDAYLVAVRAMLEENRKSARRLGQEAGKRVWRAR
jgi:hypothetical protein